MPVWSSRTFVLTLTLLTVTTLAGCVKQMSKYQYGVDAVRVNPSPELVRWLDKTSRGTQNILIDYDNSQSDRRPSSSSDEIILAYREFKLITHKPGRYPEQLYRYVLKPVRGLTAEHILEEGKGKYIVDRDYSDWVYPALMPDKVTNGTVTTDWHFCFQCFGGKSKNHHNLTLADLTSIKADSRYSSSKTSRGTIRRLSFLSKEKVTEIWALGQIPVLSGKAASEALESYHTQKATLSSEMKDIEDNKKAYRDFIKNTYQPLTFKGWTKKQDCAAEPVGYYWYGDDRVGNDNEALRENRRFISCTSKALETYDLAAYINQYSNLKDKETTLQNNIRYQGNFDNVTITPPEVMMDDAIADLEYASSQIEEVYEQRRDNAEMAQMQAQNAAWADQEVNNSMNAIQQFNNQVDQVMEDNRRMIAQIKANANNTKHISDQKLITAAKQPNNTGTKASADPASVKSDSAQQDADSKDSKQKQANRLVDSARDYKMTGTSTTYYGQDTAIDLAQTNLRNQAAKMCGDTFKTQITWSEPNCKKHDRDETYRCLQNGLVNCWEQRCETEYCSTQ